MPRWQDFENLAETILAELQPIAEVKRNDFIDGHLSGTKRQIDISIRWSSGTGNYLTIVQAKDTGRPADIKIVDEFLSVIRDVKATGGILICRSGFTGTAHTYARNCGISLLNLHDAQSANWSLQLTVPLIWIELKPRVEISYAVYLEAGDSMPRDDPLGSPLTADGGTTRINPISTFGRHWNGPSAQRSLGVTHRLTSDKPVKAFVRDASEAIQLRPVRNFHISYTVEQQAWLGQFQPADCRGLVNYLDQKAFTVSYLPLSEIPAQRDENWLVIEDAAAVAVSIRGTVVTTARVIFVEGGEIQDLDIRYLGTDDPSTEKLYFPQ